MADLNVAVKLAAQGAAATARDVGKVGGSVDALGKSAGATAGPIGKLTSLLGPAALAGAALAAGAALVNMTRMAAEEQAGIARLSASLGAANISYAANEAAINRAIEAGENKAFADDEQRESLSRLVQATGEMGKALTIQATAMDLARGTGMSLVDASVLLGKVQAGNVGILGRYGIVLKDGTTATEALAAVQARFAGQSEAYAGTAEAAWKRFDNELANVQETIGTALLPVATQLGTEISELMQELQDSGTLDKFAAALGDVASAAISVIGYLDEVAAVLSFIGEGVAIWAAPVVNFWKAIYDAVNIAVQAITIGGKVFDQVLAGDFAGAMESAATITQISTESMATDTQMSSDSVMRSAKLMAGSFEDVEEATVSMTDEAKAQLKAFREEFQQTANESIGFRNALVGAAEAVGRAFQDNLNAKLLEDFRAVMADPDASTTNWRDALVGAAQAVETKWEEAQAKIAEDAATTANEIVAAESTATDAIEGGTEALDAAAELRRQILKKMWEDYEAYIARVKAGEGEIAKMYDPDNWSDTFATPGGGGGAWGGSSVSDPEAGQRVRQSNAQTELGRAQQELLHGADLTEQRFDELVQHIRNKAKEIDSIMAERGRSVSTMFNGVLMNTAQRTENWLSAVGQESERVLSDLLSQLGDVEAEMERVFEQPHVGGWADEMNRLEAQADSLREQLGGVGDAAQTTRSHIEDLNQAALDSAAASAERLGRVYEDVSRRIRAAQDAIIAGPRGGSWSEQHGIDISGHGGATMMLDPTGRLRPIGSFATGGVVPGPRGMAQMAIVHGGERITPVGGGGGAPSVRIDLRGAFFADERQLRRALVGIVQQAFQDGSVRATSR